MATTTPHLNNNGTVSAPNGRQTWQLFGLAFGIFLATIIAPATRWIAMEQLGISAETYPASRNAIRLQRQAVACQRPNDPALQIAVAFHALGGEVPSDPEGKSQFSVSATSYLMNLRTRLPASPLIDAALLQQYAELLEASYPYPQPRIARPKGSPPRLLNATAAQRAAIANDALAVTAEGERLDPQNAYFPVMQAIANIQLERVGPALQDIERATDKPDWNNYCKEERFGLERLDNLALGRHSQFQKLSALVPTMFAQQRQIQKLTDQLRWLANLEDRWHNHIASLAIRGRMMRLGALLLTRSNNTLDHNVGRRFIANAMVGPWDLWPLKSSRVPVPIRRTAAEASLFQLYTQFLSAHPIPSLSTTSPLDEKHFTSWALGLALLSALTGFGLISTCVTCIQYRDRFTLRGPTPLPKSTRLGIILGLLAAGSLLLPFFMGARLSQLYGPIMWIAYMLVFLLLSAYSGAKSLNPLLRTAIITVTLVDGLLWILWKQRLAANLFLSLANPQQTDLLPTLYVATVFAVPTAVFISALCYSLIKRVPFMAGTLLVFQRAKLPALSLLLVAYTAVAFVTVAEERSTIPAVQQALDTGNVVMTMQNDPFSNH